MVIPRRSNDVILCPDSNLAMAGWIAYGQPRWWITPAGPSLAGHKPMVGHANDTQNIPPVSSFVTARRTTGIIQTPRGRHAGRPWKRIAGLTPLPFVHLALLAAAALLVSTGIASAQTRHGTGSNLRPKGRHDNVRPQAARRERPAPERDDPLVGVRRA